MKIIGEIFRNFFTHKDFLPPADQWPGTLFSPLQIGFCLAVAALIAFACVRCSKKGQGFLKKVFFVLWLLMLVSEPLIAWYDCAAGKKLTLEWTSILPLWPCSIFLFAAPFAIFGKGNVRYAACGYICTLGLLGGVVNFVYPATYLSRYCCISMAGLRTVFYHGALIFVAVTMLLSGYHSFREAKGWKKLLLPMVPVLVVSIPAHIVNWVVPGADYLFFKMESFFFAPIGAATPDWFSTALVYGIYLIIHTVPYLPAFLKDRKAAKEKQLEAV